MQNMEQYSEPEYTSIQEKRTAQTSVIESWISKVIKPDQESTAQTDFDFEVEKELEEGETVLWFGRPGLLDTVPYRKAALILGVITSVLLFLTVVLLIIPGAVFPIFCLPLLFGFVFGLFTFIFALGTRIENTALQQTCYLVTDRRLVIMKVGPKKREIDSHYTIFHLNRVEKSDGSGTLTFSSALLITNGQSTTTFLGRFTNIANVRDVEALICKTLRLARVNRVENVVLKEEDK